MWRTVLATLVLQTDISEFEASVLQGIVPVIGNLLGYEVADAPEMEALAWAGLFPPWDEKSWRGVTWRWEQTQKLS